MDFTLTLRAGVSQCVQIQNPPECSPTLTSKNATKSRVTPVICQISAGKVAGLRFGISSVG